MIFILLEVLSLILVAKAASKHDELRREIEEVATESKHLADDLAETLLAIEVLDLKEKTKEMLETSDNEATENIMQAMEARIKQLHGHDVTRKPAKETVDEQSDDGISIEKVSLSKSELLRKPLNKLDKIVKEIRTIAFSDSDPKMQKILRDMDARITVLENVKDYEETSKHKIAENQDLTLIEEFSNKENNLREALAKFKNISQDLKNLNLSSPSMEDAASVNRLAKIVEAMTAKLSLDEMKITVDLAFGKGKKIRIVKNDIETMIDSLVDVVDRLTDDVDLENENN